MDDRIAALALLSLDDPEAAAVLGDAVQEAGWFDVRVMQVLWPLGRAKRNGERSMSGKQRRTLDRAAWKTGHPEFFWSFASKPTAAWARAIASVVLFGTWQKGAWAVAVRARRVVTVYRNATITINGVPFGDVSNITYSTRATP